MSPATIVDHGTRSHHGADSGPWSARSSASLSAAVIVGITMTRAVGSRVVPGRLVPGSVLSWTTGPGTATGPVSNTWSCASNQTVSSEVVFVNQFGRRRPAWRCDQLSAPALTGGSKWTRTEGVTSTVPRYVMTSPSRAGAGITRTRIGMPAPESRP